MLGCLYLCWGVCIYVGVVCDYAGVFVIMLGCLYVIT